MHRIALLVFLVLVGTLFLIVWGAGPFPGPGTFTTCGTINVAGEYNLSDNIVGATESTLSGPACIVVNTSNVVFDCKGFTISNDGTLSATGISTTPTRNNITIKNCNIYQYDYGIRMLSNRSFIINNTIFENSIIGILTNVNANYTKIENNTIFNNPSGVLINSSSHFNTLNLNNFSGALYGQPNLNGAVILSRNNTISNNNFFNHTSGGIGLFLSDYAGNNTIINNTAYDNEQGFYIATNLSQTNFNTFINNTAYDNKNGFTIEGLDVPATGPSHNRFVNNTAHDNEIGFNVINSDYNNLTKNIMYNNKMFGFQIQASNNSLYSNSAYGNFLIGFIFIPGSSENIIIDNIAYWNNPNDSVLDFAYEQPFVPRNESPKGIPLGGFVFFADGGFNTVSNNHAYENNQSGIVFLSSSYNNATNNTLNDNLLYGFIGKHGNYNLFDNNTFYGNDFSGFIVQNYTDNKLFNNNASDNGIGFVFAEDSSNNIVSANIAYQNNPDDLVIVEVDDEPKLLNRTDNPDGGPIGGFVFLGDNGFNNVSDNHAYENNQSGIVFLMSPSNNVTDNKIDRNLIYGLVLAMSNDTRIEKNEIVNQADDNCSEDDREYGVYIFDSNWTVLRKNYYRNNTCVNTELNITPNSDIQVDADATEISYSLQEEIFDNPAGGLQNFTILSLNDSLVDDSTRIYWNDESFIEQFILDQLGETLPFARASFAGKAISIDSGNPIDSAVWRWNDSEVTGDIDESTFEIWEASQSGYQNMNADLDNVTNSLNLSNFQPNSVFLISYNAPTGCSNSTECSNGWACIESTCQACNDTSQCGDYGPEYVCKTNTGQCIIPECTNNDVCLPGNVCDNYQCALNAEVSVCGKIVSPGSYSMLSNLEGANVDASPLSGLACIKIATSDVEFDCNGYNITNNDTGGTTYGVLLNGSLTNVTVKNCPGISQYSNGIYVYQSDENLFENNTAFSNSENGFRFDRSDSNVILDNVANDNGYNGFVFGNSNLNIIVDNEAFNHTFSGGPGAGFYLAGDFLGGSSSNNLSNNIAHDNVHGFRVYSNSNNTDFNVLENNTAFDNNNGFNIDGSTSTVFSPHYTTLTNNTAYGNGNGFYLPFSMSNSYINNTAHHNYYYGFHVASGQFNYIYANTVYNNSFGGIFLDSTSQNYVAFNEVYNHSKGFEITNSWFNTIQSNYVHDNWEGLRFNTGTTNILLANEVFNNNLGFFVYSNSDQNMFNFNNVHNNSIGFFFLADSTNNSLALNVVANNTGDAGFYFALGSGQNNLFGNTAYGNNIGYLFDNSSNNNLTDNNAYDNNGGYNFLVASNYNNIIGNNASNNLGNGFLLLSNSNVLSSNIADNNSQGFYLASCVLNNLTDNNALNNEVGFMLNNAMFNGLFRNNASFNNEGFKFEDGADINTIKESISSNNTGEGFSFSNVTGNRLFDNMAYNNAGCGISLRESKTHNLSGNAAFGNGAPGFCVENSENNTFTDNVGYNNIAGFYLSYGYNNKLTRNTAFGNGVAGFYVMFSNGTILNSTTFYNNGNDLILSVPETGPEMVFVMEGSHFLNPLGTFQNYTNLSLADIVVQETYAINWSANPSPLPVNRTSFVNKYVDIYSLDESSALIDSIVWHWDNSELTGYNEPAFELWKYNTTDNWTKTNANLSTAANTLALTELNPESVYAILQNGTTPVIPPSQPSTGGGVTLNTITISYTRANCPDNTVSIKVSSGQGTQVSIVLKEPYYVVGAFIADSSGMVTYTPSANGTYEVTASKSSYRPTSLPFQYQLCTPSPVTPPPVQPPPLPPPPVQPPIARCTTDADCKDVEYCSKEGISKGNCVPVPIPTGACGYVLNHAWNTYECCPNTAFTCSPGYVCKDNNCTRPQYDIREITGGFVGDTGSAVAFVDGVLFIGEFRVTDPSGGWKILTTTDGKIEIDLTQPGDNKVELFVDGVVVQSAVITALPKPPGVPGERPAILDVLAQPAFWIIFLVIIVGASYLIFRNFFAGGKPPEKPAEKSMRR